MTSNVSRTTILCVAIACACLPACLSVCLPACLPVCLSVCLPACLPACLPVCLSVCPHRCRPTPAHQNVADSCHSDGAALCLRLLTLVSRSRGGQVRWGVLRPWRTTMRPRRTSTRTWVSCLTYTGNPHSRCVCAHRRLHVLRCKLTPGPRLGAGWVHRRALLPHIQRQV